MKKEYDGTSLSRQLGILMRKHSLTQQGLAEILDVKRQSIAQYLDGSAQPSIDKLYKLAEHFGCSADYLLGLSKFNNFQEELELRQAVRDDEDISAFGVGIYRWFKDYMDAMDEINALKGVTLIDRYLFGEVPFTHITGIIAAYQNALDGLTSPNPSHAKDKGELIEKFLSDIREADKSGAFIKILLEEMKREAAAIREHIGAFQSNANLKQTKDGDTHAT